MSNGTSNNPTPKRNASPQEVNDLMNSLHDAGVVNLDAPIRGAMSQARALRTAEDEGWYIAGGSGWGIVVRSE
jgi:hypothetical protein